jgi:hypothetical protein
VACDIRERFFDNSCVKRLLQILLEKGLCFTGQDFYDWTENGEQFVIAQEGVNEGDTVKSAFEGDSDTLIFFFSVYFFFLSKEKKYIFKHYYERLISWALGDLTGYSRRCPS